MSFLEEPVNISRTISVVSGIIASFIAVVAVLVFPSVRDGGKMLIATFFFVISCAFVLFVFISIKFYFNARREDREEEAVRKFQERKSIYDP